jgi:hypothetical protein
MFVIIERRLLIIKINAMKIIYLIILSTFIISCSNNNTTNTSTNSEAPVVESTVLAEAEPEENTCSVCSNKFTGNGYQEVEEGNWVLCEENIISSICSPECGNKHIEEMNNIINKASFKSDDNCSFNSDGDVLSYLIGKTFKQDGGDIEVSFKTDGATISGLEYQWVKYQTLGGYKGVVKLVCISPSNPDGTIQLWVSCREKSITDGKIVLFLM